jgi:hypothetical protein
MSAGEAKHDSPRTSRNASDAWRRSEKGRHDRNATVFVMFEKKLKHDKLEKF